MGRFSWIYSDTNYQLLDDVYANTYLLVPKPFQKEYGKAIHETCYDGYGHFGGYDVYELVALWNRDCLPSKTEVLQEPQIDNYGGLYDFEKDLQMMSDFAKGLSDAKMKKKYGEDYLRVIGINIACHDEDNEALRYPIKITTKEMEYEDIEPSKRDPEQGWQCDLEEDWENYTI